MEDKIKALANYLKCEIDDIKQEYDENNYSYGKQEYLVVTDEEAEELWEQELDIYLEDCILPDIPESVRFYFDNEKWKDDARVDGRAHSLAHYDGDENVETIDGVDYYIYRIN